MPLGFEPSNHGVRPEHLVHRLSTVHRLVLVFEIATFKEDE
jgi:hypothetical protein